MVLSIGHGHQLVAELGRPPFCRAQRPLLILALVVLGAGINVILAVPQHGIDDAGQLVGRGGDGLRHSQVRLLSAQKRPQGTVGAVHRVVAKRNASAARLTLGLVFELMTLPSVMRLFGLSPNQKAKWPALSYFVMSVPNLTDDFQRCEPVHAVDPGQVPPPSSGTGVS